MNAVAVEAMTEAHWSAVRAIYAQGIATGDATFETAVPDWPEWNRRHLAGGRLVARFEGEIVGWAALSVVSTRQVYAGVAEVSVYIAQNARGGGVGKILLAALVAESEKAGLWTLQAGILAENAVSIHLHQQAGFEWWAVAKKSPACMVSGATPS